MISDILISAGETTFLKLYSGFKARLERSIIAIYFKPQNMSGLWFMYCNHKRVKQPKMHIAKNITVPAWPSHTLLDLIFKAYKYLMHSLLVHVVFDWPRLCIEP